MGLLPQPRSSREINVITVSKVREAYIKLSENYKKMLKGDYLLCPRCKEWHPQTHYIPDKFYGTGYYPICKDCIDMLVEQKTIATDVPNETKESVQKVLRLMNRVYDDALYEKCKTTAEEQFQREGRRVSPFSIYLSTIRNLKKYNTKTWDDSEFEDIGLSDNDGDSDYVQIIKAAKKRFGTDYSTMDLYFLETQYEDWVQRYSCETKAQEILFQRIVFTQLAIDKAQKKGLETKELDKTLQDLMSSSSIRPSQNNANALTEAKSFGQLIEKWEQEKPIPEPEEEFKDIDRVGLYVDVFFKGHLAKMMGLKNAFSTLYDNIMRKYTVTKPQYNEDSGSEELFNAIFGTKLDDI